MVGARDEEKAANQGDVVKARPISKGARQSENDQGRVSGCMKWGWPRDV